MRGEGVLERIGDARRRSRQRAELARIMDECGKLLTERGESNSVAIAAQIVASYRRLGAEGVREFFDALATRFEPDAREVLRLAEQYAATRAPIDLIRLSRVVEPPRQELLRRINRAPDGTATVVAMRAQLLHRLRAEPGLEAVDADFQHLLSSWFNPGFLRLARVDWDSPAALLEKIIQHEAVHAIDGWADLRRRLEPDRRCFAFFHPALPDEPLIFVEVALLSQMPAAIAPLIDRHSPTDNDPAHYRVAVFYSISNCQPGLRGVNLGNFLIKRVAERLAQEFPRLRTFCTLSPVPTFARWLSSVETIRSGRLRARTLADLNEALAQVRGRAGDERAAAAAPQDNAAFERALQRLCAFYLTHTTASDGPESDPVARFHLNNGARLERVNVRGDESRKGVRESHGTMVNYLYDLEQIEANHERFAGGAVNASRAVKALL